MSSLPPTVGAHDSDTLQNFFDRVRSQIEREDELIYHRTYWLLTTQAILFAAYTIALQSERPDPQAALETDRHMIRFLLYFTPIVGLLVSVTNFVATLAAHEAIRYLRRDYRDQCERFRLPSGTVPLPRLVSEGCIDTFGAVPSRTLAPLFFYVWLTVFCNYTQGYNFPRWESIFFLVPWTAMSWALLRDAGWKGKRMRIALAFIAITTGFWYCGLKIAHGLWSCSAPGATSILRSVYFDGSARKLQMTESDVVRAHYSLTTLLSGVGK